MMERKCYHRLVVLYIEYPKNINKERKMTYEKNDKYYFISIDDG